MKTLCDCTHPPFFGMEPGPLVLFAPGLLPSQGALGAAQGQMWTQPHVYLRWSCQPPKELLPNGEL